MDVLNNLSKNFLNEQMETYTIGYEMDNEERSYNTQANSTGEARRKFHEYMKANGQSRADYRIMGVYKATFDDIEESNTTSNLDGGEGQVKIPHAFQRNNPTKKDKEKERENATRSTGYSLAKKTNKYVKRRDEMISRTDRIMRRINEISYKEYKNDDSVSHRKKINDSIRKVNRSLMEIERSLNHASKLKNEIGMGDDFYANTKKYLRKVNERLLRISNKIREISR